MKIARIMVVFLVFCLSHVAGTYAEVVYNTTLISDIEYTDVYNSVLSNVLENYWDGEGDFYGKETGLWRGDWMGDSHLRGVDNLSAIFNDSRLLAGASSFDRFDTRRDLLRKANRTIDYTIYALNKVPSVLLTYFLTGQISNITEGELYAAFAGGFGFAGGYEMADAPGYLTYAPIEYPSWVVRLRYLDNGRDFADMMLNVLGDEDLRQALSGATLFSVGWAASSGAWAMYRTAMSDTLSSDRVADMLTAADFMDLLSDDQDSEFFDTHQEHIKALLLRAQLTGNSDYLDQAIEMLDDYVDPAPASVLSRNLNKIDSYLAVYEIQPEPEYLLYVENLFNYIMNNQLVDDPNYPGYKIVAHDNGRASRVKNNNWPSGEYPACTGCNHHFLHLIFKYDQLKNN